MIHNEYKSNFKVIEEIAKKYQPKKPIKFDVSVLMPPPNVTGNLHMGHALNNFINDTMVRYLKFFGTNVQFIPGTDHGGIGTEMIVRNKLLEKKVNFSRNDLLQEIWDWKKICEHNIISLIKNMNLLIDWDAYKFTLDEDVSEIVINAFCKLYRNKLIFREKRLVNWDIKLQTVLSDIEVVNKNVQGVLYYLKYEIKDGGYIEVATTRPETLFADVAVAVNFDDSRYKHMIGHLVKAPLLNEWIPVVGYQNIEIDKGSGALKIDPAHASLDFEIGQQYKLNTYQVIDKNGKMCGHVPYWLNGIDRFKAREIVVAKLKENNLIVREEMIMQSIPHGAKSNSILEPMITMQWFFDIAQLSESCIDLVQNEWISFIPEHTINLYMHYMKNLQPWCISRQLVWGHRMPAWYDNNGNVYVAKNKNEAQKLANTSELIQDEDVLDTWFSSALWPLSTSSIKPEDYNNNYENYINCYLVTGNDILFFWVSKMIIMNAALGNKKFLPFQKVYLHGLVQDCEGKKMSKTVGNATDPTELFDTEGLDVARFALLYSTTSIRNIKFSTANIEKSRKFLIKIWNAFNFCINNIQKVKPELIYSQENLWIIQQINTLEETVAKYMADWDIYNAAHSVYNVFWNDFCSIYLEIFKYNNQKNICNESQYTLFVVMHKLLKVMDPFLPCIAQYFYSKLTKLENIYDSYKDIVIEINSVTFEKIIRIIENIRSIGKNLQIKTNADIYINFEYNLDMLSYLTKYSIKNIKEIESDMSVIDLSINGLTIKILKNSIDGDLFKIVDKIQKTIIDEINIIESKLCNKGFLDNADLSDINEKKMRLETLYHDKTIYKKLNIDFHKN